MWRGCVAQYSITEPAHEAMTLYKPHPAAWNTPPKCIQFQKPETELNNPPRKWDVKALPQERLKQTTAFGINKRARQPVDLLYYKTASRYMLEARRNVG